MNFIYRVLLLSLVEQEYGETLFSNQSKYSHNFLCDFLSKYFSGFWIGLIWKVPSFYNFNFLMYYNLTFLPQGVHSCYQTIPRHRWRWANSNSLLQWQILTFFDMIILYRCRYTCDSWPGWITRRGIGNSSCTSSQVSHNYFCVPWITKLTCFYF